VGGKGTAGRLPGVTSGAPALLLWDIDHTLIDNGGMSKRNYAVAYELLTGEEPRVRAETGGRTDVAIVANLLIAHGRDPKLFPVEDQWDALAEAGRRNYAELCRRGRALPGAANALARLADDPDVIQSVLSGNIHANARVKLSAFGLHRYLDFSVGAFGAESAVRADLVAVAQRKAHFAYGFRPDEAATVLIGDTPRDVEAGLDGGAHVIAVCTGGVDAEALSEAGAHAVLEDLVDVEALVEAVHAVRLLGPAQPVRPVIG
jgi:phosphoglycolate phosphatase-like HAD superfamily hydrolase